MKYSLPVIVIGAGGHAAVVADALLAGGATVLGFTDANPERHGRVVCGLPVLGDDRVLAEYSGDGVVLANGLGGLGDERVPARQRLQQSLEDRGWRFCSVIHPNAIVSRFAQLGESVQVMAGSVIQAGASIGIGSVVNTGAIIEHDVSLGAWSNVAPRAVVCGQVRIGAVSYVGAGATVRQGVCIGAHTLIGAGAVVVKDFSGNGVLVGVPARPVERRK
jgi:sugar O-acyltransferase (sialic acid O-acetyltransferase NeuD family)